MTEFETLVLSIIFNLDRSRAFNSYLIVAILVTNPKGRYCRLDKFVRRIIITVNLFKSRGFIKYLLKIQQLFGSKYFLFGVYMQKKQAVYMNQKNVHWILNPHGSPTPSTSKKEASICKVFPLHR